MIGIRTHKILALLLILAALLTSVSCDTQTGENRTDTTDPQKLEATDQEQEVPEETDPTHYYEVVTDKITIDAEIVPLPDGVIPTVYEGEVPILNEEIALGFLARVGDSVTETGMNEYLDELKLWRYYAETENGVLGGSHRVGSEDVTIFELSYTAYKRMKPYSEALCYYDAHSRVRNPEWDNSHVYRTPQSFAFGTEQEVLEQVQEIFHFLGIYNAVHVDTLYMDHKTMAEQDRINATEKAKLQVTSETESMEDEETVPEYQWTEADDAYYFFFEFAHEGIFAQRSIDVEDRELYVPSEVRVIWNQEGLYSMYLYQPWVFTEPVEEAGTIMSATEAIERAKEILQLSIVPYQRVVDSVALRYYYTREGTQAYLRPCWVIDVLGVGTQQWWKGEPVTEPMDKYDFIIIDAITGQER